MLFQMVLVNLLYASAASVAHDRREWLNEARCFAICLEQLGSQYEVERRDGTPDVYTDCGTKCKQASFLPNRLRRYTRFFQCRNNCHVNRGDEKKCSIGCQTTNIISACNRSCIAYADVAYLPIDHQCRFKATGVKLICMNLVGDIHSPTVLAWFEVGVTPQELNSPIIYALEFRKRSWNRLKSVQQVSPWQQGSLQSKKWFSIKKLLCGDFYQIRALIVTSNGVVEEGAVSDWHQMLRADSPLGPVSNIQVKEYLKNANDLRMIVSWKPNRDYPSCYYSLALVNNGTVRPRTFLIGKFAYEMSQLAFDTNYTVHMRSVSSTKLGGMESSITSYKMKSMSCLEANAFSYCVCAPDVVRHLQWSYSNRTLRIQWQSPDHLQRPINRNVQIGFRTLFKSLIGTGQCISHVKMEQYVPSNITCVSYEIPTDDCQYDFHVAANSSVGLGKDVHFTFNPAFVQVAQPTHNVEAHLQLICIAIALLVVTFVILICVYRRQRGRAPKIEIAMDGMKECESGQVVEKCVLSSLKIETLLGEGAFGCVFRATCNAPDMPDVLAVKMLKNYGHAEAKKHMLREIDLLKKLTKHPNVTECFGYCVSDGEPMMLLEFCSNGNLKDFLNCTEQSVIAEITDGKSAALYYGVQIAKGMEHIALNNLVHRDLAARNILTCNGGRVAKISDFGLSRLGNVYFQMSAARLPAKWMAPECLFHQIFSTKSDVWSFGIVLWEIVSPGAEPYSFVNLLQLMQLLKSSYRLTRPTNCDPELYGIMVGCWNAKPECRPSFTELRNEIQALLDLK